MKNRVLIIGVLCLISCRLNAQAIYITENENDIYWQPNVQVDFSDYQSSSNENCLKYYEKYGLSMSSTISIRGVVDIPKKKKKKKKKYDKFYIAPVFCKNCSCILSEDSLILQVDRLLFDMAEVCARNARKELLELQKKMNTDNTYSMFFTTVKNEWDEKLWSAFGTIIREILIDKKDNAYIDWRDTVDEVLLRTETYATQPEDCYRFVINEPIEKGYIMAQYIVGDMRNKKGKE